MADQTGPTMTAPTPEQMREQIAKVLDKYDQGEGECAPEDCWRLFRDLRALVQNETDR